VSVAVRGTRRALPATIEDHLFRVGQEALTNAVRHGHPRAVSVVLTYDRRRVELVVEDDGTGFRGAPPASRDGGGLGLVGMRERMAQVGGSLEVTSDPAAGTRVHAAVPIAAVPGEPAS
jgi:signal transduction histidine kinase